MLLALGFREKVPMGIRELSARKGVSQAWEEKWVRVSEEGAEKLMFWCCGVKTAMMGYRLGVFPQQSFFAGRCDDALMCRFMVE